MKKRVKQILANAQRLNELKQKIKETLENRDNDREAWSKACETFHAAFDTLAFPGGLERGIERLRQKEPGAVEDAIAFLKADPHFFRSGYIKEKIIRLLKRVELTAAQRNEIREIIQRAFEGRTPARILREFRRLEMTLNKNG